MKAMWNRIDLKERAKNVLRGCFWSAVVVALITGILTGSFSGGSSGRGQVQETTYNSIQDNGGNMVGSATDLIFENARQPQNILARIAGMGFGVVILGIGVTMVLFGFSWQSHPGGLQPFLHAGQGNEYRHRGSVLCFPPERVLECRADHVRDECEDLSLGTSFCDSGHCEILRVPDGSLYSGGKSKSSDV